MSIQTGAATRHSAVAQPSFDWPAICAAARDAFQYFARRWIQAAELNGGGEIHGPDATLTPGTMVSVGCYRGQIAGAIRALIGSGSPTSASSNPFLETEAASAPTLNNRIANCFDDELWDELDDWMKNYKTCWAGAFPLFALPTQSPVLSSPLWGARPVCVGYSSGKARLTSSRLFDGNMNRLRPVLAQQSSGASGGAPSNSLPGSSPRGAGGPSSSGLALRRRQELRFVRRIRG